MFKKTDRKNYITIHTSDKKGKPEVPEGLLKKCNACKSAIFTEDVKRNYYICPKCHNYFRVHAWRRVEMIADEGSFEEWDHDMKSSNPLNFKGYEEKVRALQEKRIWPRQSSPEKRKFTAWMWCSESATAVS